MHVFEIDVVSIAWTRIESGSGGIIIVAHRLIQCRFLVASLREESIVQQKVNAHHAICMQVALGNATTADKRLGTCTCQDVQLAWTVRRNQSP
jgi:hypothetical protein